MAPLPLEVAVFSAADALVAQSLGASRIELNAAGSYPCGGLTPFPSSSSLACLRIPLRVMIRPRGAPLDTPDFLYTAAEVAAMRAAMAAIQTAGVLDPARGDGFVFGALTQAADGTLAVDADTCKDLVARARPLACVFHRAFDAVEDQEAGVDVLVDCGFVGVLTAGGTEGGCAENGERLGAMVARARGRLQVVAGGGVRHHNVGALRERYAQEEGGGVWVHSAALRADGTGLDEEELRKLLEALGK